MTHDEQAAFERKHASEYLQAMRTDHEVLNSFAWTELVTVVLFYAAIIGLGVLVGWLVWG